MFVVYGPNTNLGGTSIISMLEAASGAIMTLLRHTERQGARSVAVRPEAEQRFDEEIQGRLSDSVWLSCHNWYHQDGGRIWTKWPGLVAEYQRRCATSTWTTSSRPEPQSPVPVGTRETNSLTEVTSCTAPRTRPGQQVCHPGALQRPNPAPLRPRARRVLDDADVQRRCGSSTSCTTADSTAFPTTASGTSVCSPSDALEGRLERKPARRPGTARDVPVSPTSGSNCWTWSPRTTVRPRRRSCSARRPASSCSTSSASAASSSSRSPTRSRSCSPASTARPRWPWPSCSTTSTAAAVPSSCTPSCTPTPSRPPGSTRPTAPTSTRCRRSASPAAT